MMLKNRMKKYAVCLSVICMTMLCSVFSVNAAVTVYGDANADLKVNVKDLVRVKKYLSNGNVAINLEAVDDNESGKVETSDLNKLKKVLLGGEDYGVEVMEADINWPDSWDD